MLKINSLRIDYDDITAVRDLSVEIQKGQIYGLVGPNGAGKTSTIKALAGVLEPTYGEISINGHDLDLERSQALQDIGYMPDFPPVYENLKVWEYLDVFAAAYLIDRRQRLERARHWVKQVNLENKWDSFIRDLSRGMRQRLVLAKTVLPNPKVLLLDEPASGLDPIARREFRDLLKRIAAEGMTILISSHILTELSEFCNAIGIMEKGKMVVSGSIEEIRKAIHSTGYLIVRLAQQDPLLERAIAILSESSQVQKTQKASETEIQAHFSGSRQEAAQLLSRLVAERIPVAEFIIKEDDVEDIFFKIGAKDVT